MNTKSTNNSFWTRAATVMMIAMLLLAAMPATPAFAASSGPNFAGTGANVTGVGTYAWTGPGGITADDATYATATNVLAGSSTNYIQGTNYGFAIPTNATINGIQVTIARGSSGISGPYMQDIIVRLVKADTIVGNNYAAIGTNWPNGTTIGTATYGGAADLWGTTWTPADINATNFGVVLSAINAGSTSKTASVDYMQVTVTYSMAISGDGLMAVSPTSAVYGSTSTFVFTFTATGNFGNGSQVALDIPAGWTAPTVAPGAGHVSWATGTCTLNADPMGITLQRISIDIVSCLTGQSFTITYAGVPVPAISGSPYTFDTWTDIPGGAGLTGIAASPTVTVTPAALSITANNASKTYGAAKTFAGTEFTTLGLVNSDSVSSVTLTSTGAAATAAAGNYDIVPSAAVGTGLGNYTITYFNGTLTVDPAPLTITAQHDDRVYNGTPSSLVAPQITSGALVAGDTATLTQAFDTKHVGTAKTLSAAGSTINDGNGGNNYLVTFVNDTTGVITQYNLQVTAVTDSKGYDGTPSSTGAPTITLGALQGSDTVTWTQTFDTKHVGTGKTLTPTGAVNDGNGGANYTVTPVNDTTGVITPANVSVTANPQTKVYGAADPALTYIATPALFGTDAFTGLLARAAGENVGAYAINQGTLSAGSNYAISFTGNNLSVTKAALNAKANDKSITFGSPDPLFDITYTGFQFTDTAAVVTTAPTCGVIGAHTAVGTYPITCSGGAAANYTFTYTNGTLTVSSLAAATFSDVPTTYWSWRYIEALYAAGITSGCGTSPLIYCPTTEVTRAQMAVFILKAKHGTAYSPPAATGSVFLDVPLGHWAGAWIEALAAEGITAGCGNNNYCPDTAVTRAQMAVFLLRGKYGNTYTPPPATGTLFADVPLGYWSGAWIEQLAAEGVTSGCDSNNYCPDTVVTRDQMAVFLVRTFNLPLP